jgi:YidC/Oxa1 family membrane protein insertase
MDRRTVLAFILIAVVLAINLVFMDKTTPRRPAPGSVAESLAVRSPSERGLGEAAPPATPSQVAPFAPAGETEPEVVVHTPLYRARISMAGAVITAFELEHYDRADGGKVDLIAPAGDRTGAALAWVLHTPGGDVDLSRARFEPGTNVPASGTVEVAAGAEPRRLTLRCPAAGGGAVLKHFVFDPQSYAVHVELELEPGPAMPRVERYTLAWSRGVPTTEMNQSDDWFSFAVESRVNHQVQRVHAGGRMALGRGGREKVTELSGELEWMCMKSKYFTVALIPEPAENGSVRLRTDPSTHWMGMEVTQPLPWKGSPREAYRIYAGPISYKLLAAQGVGLEAIVELGWSWVRPFSRLILAFMNFLHGFIPNYGVIILILSSLAKLVFWPLSKKSFRSMREMQNLQPLMQELRRRYENDPKELNRQMMELYRQKGVNPLGGCMPLVVQMPIFIALYSVLRSSIDLRNAPFVLWIDNLAAPDALFHLPFPLPILGRTFNLLPLLMGAAMLWQSRLSPSPAATGPAAQQQAIMRWAMPIMMTVFFYKVPSGLVLYWLVNTVLSVWQQVMINRSYAPAAAVSTEPAKREPQGGDDHGAPDRGDGRKRTGSAGKSAGRAGSPAE